MLELAAAAGIGASIAALTKYYGKLSTYRWWTSWKPELERQRKVITVIAAVVGAAVGFLGVLLTTLVSDELEVRLGGAAGLSFVTALFLNTDPAKLTGIFASMPFKLLKDLLASFEEDADKQTREEITHLVNQHHGINELTELVNFCRSTHDANVENYGHALKQSRCARSLQQVETQASSSDPAERNEALGIGCGLAIQMIVYLKITKKNVVPTSQSTIVP